MYVCSNPINESEISPFLTVIAFIGRLKKKRVGRSPQEI